MPTGLGINAMPDPDNEGSYLGRLAKDERRVIAAQFQNTGVLAQPVVTLSSSAMTYKVGANVVVASRGASDGATIFPVDEQTLTVAPTSGLPRIDVIYAYQHDYEQGDADNQSGYGVVKGTPASSPSEPAVPANTQRVAAYQVKANASVTTGSTRVGGTAFAVPYGGSMGTLFTARDTSTTFGGNIIVGTGSFYLPTDRSVRVDLTTTATAVQANVGTVLTKGSMWVELKIDGKVVRNIERWLTDIAKVDFYSESFSLSAGTHTVQLRLFDGVSGWKRYYSATGWPGQVIKVTDEGVNS